MYGYGFHDFALFLILGVLRVVTTLGFAAFTGSPVAAFSTSPPFSPAISASNRLLKTERGSAAVMSFCEAYLSRCLINNQDLSGLLPKPRVRTSTQEPHNFLPTKVNFRSPFWRAAAISSLSGINYPLPH